TTMNVKERERNTYAHDHYINQQCQAEAQIFSQQELTAADWLGKNRVKRAPLDLVVNPADADEDRDEGAKQKHRTQAKIDDDLGFLSRGKLTQKYRSGNQQQHEEDEIVENSIADCFAKRVAGNCHHGTRTSS